MTMTMNRTTNSPQINLSNESGLMSLLIGFAAIFIQPVGVLIGMVGNIWILITLLTTNVQISTIPKLYYIFLASADFIICVKNLFYNVLCDTLFIISNGKYSFCFDSLSQLTCVLMASLYHVSENAGNYAVAAFSIERMIAVMFPLKASYLLGKKFTTVLLLLFILPECLYFLIVIPFIKKLKVLESRPSWKMCSQEPPRDFLAFSFQILQFIYILTLHVLINLSATLLMTVKLNSTRKQRRLLFQNESKARQMNDVKENRCTKILISMALLNLLINGLVLSSRLAILATQIFPKVEKGIFILFNGFLVFTVMLTIIPHCSNIFIYLILIPSFRKAALCKK